MSFADTGEPNDIVRSKSAGWAASGLPLAEEVPTVHEDGPSKQSPTRSEPSHAGPQTSHVHQTKRTSRPGTPVASQAFDARGTIFENASGDTGTGVPKIYFNRRTLNFVIMLPDGEMLEGRIFNVFFLHPD